MLSVFLVEDEMVVREGIKRIVPWSSYGFSFAGEAPDGEIAFPMIREIAPDIVITDIRMPFMDGLSLSRLVKEELPNAKIIILTGHDDFRYAQEAISIGVNQYLLKPISKDSLVEALNLLKLELEREAKQKEYILRFQRESQEYDKYSWREFLEKLFSGQLTIDEIMVLSKRIGVDLVAQSGVLQGENLKPPLNAVDPVVSRIGISRFDPALIENFLKDGLVEDIERFIDEYFVSIGKDQLESLLFRQYVIVGMIFISIGFIDRIGCSKDEFIYSLGLTDNLIIMLKTPEETQCFAGEILKNALAMRDANTGRRYKDMLSRALKFIEEHFTDEYISLNDVARAVNISATHFSAVFSREMGVTFVEYLTKLRMDRARELLRGTRMRSSEIASAIGYKDPNYFSFLFKKIQGCTPRDYRNRRMSK